MNKDKRFLVKAVPFSRFQLQLSTWVNVCSIWIQRGKIPTHAELRTIFEEKGLRPISDSLKHYIEHEAYKPPASKKTTSNNTSAGCTRRSSRLHKKTIPTRVHPRQDQTPDMRIPTTRLPITRETWMIAPFPMKSLFLKN
jgi:hypothetical protein